MIKKVLYRPSHKNSIFEIVGEHAKLRKLELANILKFHIYFVEHLILKFGHDDII